MPAVKARQSTPPRTAAYPPVEHVDYADSHIGYSQATTHLGREDQTAAMLCSSFRPGGGYARHGRATSAIRWTILPSVTVDAYPFNGQVPRPTIRFREGDRGRIDVINRLPETTTVHWHGLILPNVMDGPALITQAPIENGQLYRYEFTVLQSGPYLYHSPDHIAGSKRSASTARSSSTRPRPIHRSPRITNTRCRFRNGSSVKG